MISQDLLSLIGNTPLVEISALNPFPNVKILAKLEFMNPGGSIKDRVAKAMIEQAEKDGLLTPDKTVIEATSGNTGIGLAMACATKGYKCSLIMSEAASEERKRILKAYGAGIIMTPARLATDGAIETAYRMAREEPDKYVLMDQYNNPACVEAHYNGTGLEIWNQTEGAVTHVVCTLGTSGTAMGIVKRIREMSDTAQVVAVEPRPGHKIQGLKNMHESYPPGIYDRKALHQVVRVDDEEAFETCRRLAKDEGLFVGMSSGAGLAAALKIAEGLESGLMVVVFPDSGERYLSTTLFTPPPTCSVGLNNLATGKSQKLVPTSGGLDIFTMGPSLDKPGNLDAWRRIVLADVLCRHLGRENLDVKCCVGLADMDDRSLKAARDHNMSRAEYVEQALAELGSMALGLGISEHVKFVPAGADVDRCLDLCRKLLVKGLAYEKLRSVYFDVLRDKEYGSLAHVDMDKLSLGKTVDLAGYVKENPRDFTLLKRASLQDLKNGDILETEWGNVRPSWFLQLASAAVEGLDKVDVVIASQAYVFPHLENLRAIWASAGRSPQAWLAAQPVAKGQGLDGMRQVLESGHHPLAVRMWLLSASYHKPLSLTGESLSMWVANWRKLQDAVSMLRQADKPGAMTQETEQAVFDFKAGFIRALDEDLSIHHFWPVLFRFLKEINTVIQDNRLTAAGAQACLATLDEMNAVLGIIPLAGIAADKDLEAELEKLIQDRETARKQKDFAKADEIRDRIAALGFRIEDTQDGARVYPL